MTENQNKNESGIDDSMIIKDIAEVLAEMI